MSDVAVFVVAVATVVVAILVVLAAVVVTARRGRRVHLELDVDGHPSHDDPPGGAQR